MSTPERQKTDVPTYLNPVKSPFSPSVRRTVATRLPGHISSFEDGIKEVSRDMENEIFLGQKKDISSSNNLCNTFKHSMKLSLSSSCQSCGSDTIPNPGDADPFPHSITIKNNEESNMTSVHQQYPVFPPLASPTTIKILSRSSSYRPRTPVEKGFTLNAEDFEFYERIDEGAYGIVWRARLKNKPVAVKVQSIPSDEQEQANILIELSILHGLNHSHLVHYLGAALLDEKEAIHRSLVPPSCIEDDHPLLLGNNERGSPPPSSSTTLVLIAMELCERGSLRQALEREREHLSWSRKVRIANDIANGLAFLHAHGLLHRDLKTTNILLDSTWRAKICDHSFAIAASSPDVKSFTCGTVEFMSPEMLLDPSQCDVKSDIFSYGIILCEMMAEKPPGEAHQFLLRKSQTFFEIDPHEVEVAVLPGCPPSLSVLAVQCTRAESNERPTALEVSEWTLSLFHELEEEQER